MEKQLSKHEIHSFQKAVESLPENSEARAIITRLLADREAMTSKIRSTSVESDKVAKRLSREKRMAKDKSERFRSGLLEIREIAYEEEVVEIIDRALGDAPRATLRRA